MATKRVAKEITKKEDLDEILSLSDHDCLKLSIAMEYFGEFNGKVRFHPYDWIKVPKGTFHNNKNEFTTTIGAWLFNKGCLSWSGVFEESYAVRVLRRSGNCEPGPAFPGPDGSRAAYQFALPGRRLLAVRAERHPLKLSQIIKNALDG